MRGRGQGWVLPEPERVFETHPRPFPFVRERTRDLRCGGGRGERVAKRSAANGSGGAQDFDGDAGGAGADHADVAGGAERQVDQAALGERAAIVDADDHVLAI